MCYDRSATHVPMLALAFSVVLVMLVLCYVRSAMHGPVATMACFVDAASRVRAFGVAGVVL